MKFKLVLFLFVFSFFHVSCDDNDSCRKVKFDLEEFNSNRDKWEALNLQDYSYEYSNSGYSFTGIASDISVQIINGEEAEVIALVENGDTIVIDAETNRIEVLLSDEELALRKTKWEMPTLKAKRGVLYKYAKTVSSASLGCVTDKF